MVHTHPLLSADLRTAPLFSESGCKDVSDSRSVLEALGPANQVMALARGRHGTDAVTVIVADHRVIVVAVGFLSDLGNAFRATSPVRLDASTDSVTFRSERPSVGKPGHGTAMLETATEHFTIQDVPDKALARLSEAFTADPTTRPTTSAQPGPTPRPGTTTEDRTSTTPSSSGPAATDWRQAEQLAVWHLRQLGYHDAHITGASADSGVDVVATGAVAQVKHWSRPVGQPPLRDLFGVAQAAASKALFYSLSGYTPQALQWATTTNTALYVYSQDGSVRAYNATAHDLQRDNANRGGKRLGFFAQARADRYRREQENLRRQIETLTSRMQRRTQSRRPAARQAAGLAAELLVAASHTLDTGDILPPADRRREDTYKLVRDTLARAKRLL